MSSSTNITTRLFAAHMDRDCPTLDIHGRSRVDADIMLRHFLDGNVGHESARIIFGHGNGILSQLIHTQLPQFVQKRQLIDGFEIEPGGGSCVVIFKQ